MANRTENVLADLATLFNSHADKVQAVPELKRVLQGLMLSNPERKANLQRSIAVIDR